MQKDLTFFHEIVRTLFASMDLMETLPDTLRSLQQYFPLEAITFDTFKEKLGTVTVLFLVNSQGFFPVNRSFHVLEEAQDFLRMSERSRSIHIHPNNLEHDIVRQHNEIISDYIPFKTRGYMNSVLVSGNEVLGHLVFVGTENAQFTAQHERLIGMLLSPFSIVFRHRFAMETLRETHERLDAENARLERELSLLVNTALIGSKSGLKNVIESIKHLENKDTPVLILGETGTGKELIADAVQRISRRRNDPFIKINCGAIPENLMESELFGHEKGAFTGATLVRNGYFERAHGGTLFLDEIGELSLQAQVQLLRILQTGVFERIGGSRSIKVDVRIIAATNQDLFEMRKQGRFREDLYHRLSVFPVYVPPLRERIEDLPLLIRHFVNNTAARMNITPPALCSDSMDRLMQYPWPGNVRELENLVERALIFDPTSPLDIAKYLPQDTSTYPDSGIDERRLESLIDRRIAQILTTVQGSTMEHRSLPSSPLIFQHEETRTLDEHSREHILEALVACNGKIYGTGGAAERLGMKHGTLRYRMKKLGIDPQSWKNSR